MDLHSIKAFFRPLYVPVMEELTFRQTQRRCPIRILSSRQTIRMIKEKGLSISRYGDGEMNVMLNGGKTRFQAGSDQLAEDLKRVFFEENQKLLICLPRCIISPTGMKRASAAFWKDWIRGSRNWEQLYRLVSDAGKDAYLFGDSLITRPFIDWKSKKRADVIFRELKTLWEGRDLLIVEGEQTRLGVGNDLFSNASSVKRILAPAIGAYENYAEIKQTVMKRHSNELVLLALGPAATVLAADLAREGIQTLDIGHVDIEYEWYLRGSKEKEAISGKYTNEVKEGRVFSDCNDQTYLQQIIARVNC